MKQDLIRDIKQEARYYLGHSITTQEAEEIAWFWEQNPNTSLCEIIEDYFNALNQQ